jgi:hypothetical protein
MPVFATHQKETVAMTRKNWKRANPRSLREALELCKDHAISVHRRSVERIAELAGEESHWTVYGWLRDGSIPAKKIHAFEHACGCDFITRYLAHSNGQLLINIPAGRAVSGEDIHALQSTLTAFVGTLLGYAQGTVDGDTVVGELFSAMEGLAFWRENVTREPELEFGND